MIKLSFNDIILQKKKEVNMFVDVHAHIIDEKFENPVEVVERAKFCGVDKIICAIFTIHFFCAGVEKY